METAKEPVVTKCGHLFCWPCIYKWLYAKQEKAQCPNCKNPISSKDLIPLYGKGDNAKRNCDVPRPNAGRNKEPEPQPTSNFNFHMGFGPFPFGPMFGFSTNSVV